MSQLSTRRGWKAAALGGALVLALAACGGGSSGDGDGDQASSEPIRIGTSLPLTGEFSQPGKAAKEGYEVWQAMVNESGGLLDRDVELVVKDDASNQNTIVADYNALISQDKVDLLLGTFSSLLNLPASAVAERNQMLYVEPAGGSPDMFNRGFEYLFFAQQATADKQGKVFAEWVASLPEDERPKTAAYPTLDDPFAAPNVEGIRGMLEDAGIKTVYQETYAIDTKNFDTIVNAMKNADPDLVVHGAQFEDGIGMTRSMLKADFTPDMFFQTNAPSFGDQFTEGIGEENTEGVIYAVSHSPTADTPGNKEFVAKYEEMFGSGEVPEDAADAYAAGQVLQAAVEAVGSIDDQQALADWLHENEVDTILGPLSWDETGAPQGEFLIGQWQNGKPEIVLPEEAATAEIEAGWSPGGAG
ncbi:MAG TPA: amino acid ABC transporter substrate-binding protein [Nocardioides sp.]|jgi:branched-chain amino acid transport system substrate-binding protein|nr:amino acid ABC transporter substrate-binding protein [uncultured Nocardioides sp.]HEX5985309.1 amino acid ABC transporter substrate-binding protein [Nocardioides sp.]